MDLSKYHKKGLVGLENLGNTCFLNACMQVLNNMYELNHFLDSDAYKRHVKDGLPDASIINEWDDLRTVMWSGNGVVAPRKFVHNVQHIAKQKKRDIFTGWAQNDMPEFLQFFIECIHNSISRSVNIKINGNPENQTDKLAVKCYEMLKNSYSNEYSEIMEMFYGIYFSELVSKNTGKVLSIVPESFFVLDIPISSGERTVHTLYECFDLFTQPEYLEGDNAWYNEETKAKENVKKQYSFWNFPNIVVIALQRFSPDGLHKMSNQIEFPINDLDLSPYVRGYNANNYMYDLFGVCNHVGNVSGGHYTAFVKNSENGWVHYNDNIVEKVQNPNVVISPMAYCLFYRKKNNLL
jgi:ubiquitin C-terminal hydrolase